MSRVFSILILLGIALWAFLLLERVRPDQVVEQGVSQLEKVPADNANTTDRCARYRQNSEDDLNTWALGYEGRIRQLIHGCF